MKRKPKRSARVVSNTLVEQLLDYDAMAAVLGIKSRTLRDYVYAGMVPYLKLGHRTIRFEPSRVVNALRRREVREVA
jgi:predicted site-specific integrase-resolvase